MNLKRRNKVLTNYYKRIKYIESNKDRLVIRFTNRYIIASLFKFQRIGDACTFYKTTKHLTAITSLKSTNNLKNKYFAYVFAIALSKQLKDKEFIIDSGLYAPKNKERLAVFINTLNFALDKSDKDLDDQFYKSLEMYFNTDKNNIVNNYATMDS